MERPLTSSGLRRRGVMRPFRAFIRSPLVVRVDTGDAVFREAFAFTTGALAFAADFGFTDFVRRAEVFALVLARPTVNRADSSNSRIPSLAAPYWSMTLDSNSSTRSNLLRAFFVLSAFFISFSRTPSQNTAMLRGALRAPRSVSADLLGHCDSPALDRSDERSVIGFGLVRVLAGKVPKRLRHFDA